MMEVRSKKIQKLEKPRGESETCVFDSDFGPTIFGCWRFSHYYLIAKS